MEEGRRDVLQPAWKTTVFFLHPGSSWRLRKSPLAVSFTWKFDKESLGDHNMTFDVQLEESKSSTRYRKTKSRNFSIRFLNKKFEKKKNGMFTIERKIYLSHSSAKVFFKRRGKSNQQFK